MSMNKKILLAMTIILLGLFCYSNQTMASDQLTGSFKTVSENILAYKQMDASSESVKINAGEMILVVDQADNWVHIVYGGEELYIHKADSKAISDLVNPDAAEELKRSSQTDKSWIESYAAQNKAARNAQIWRIAIMVIIVAVVVLIVVTSIMRHNMAANEEKTQE